MGLWGSNPLNASSGISGNFGCFAYLSEPTITTVTTASLWYPIEGTFTNSPCENFSAATVTMPGIKYDGLITRYFSLSGQLSFKSNKNTVTLSTGVKKNNVFQEASEMSALAKVNNEAYFISFGIVLELDLPDEIQLVVTTDVADTEITIDKFTILINTF